jgi:aarF domain-containing kinase
VHLQMTQVDDEIKFGMIEAISHLIHRDYEAIVQVRVYSLLE